MARKKRQMQSNQAPLLLIGFGGLLILVAVIAMLSQNNRQQAAVNSEAAEAAVERISLADAKAAFDSGEAVFVDVRGPAGFNAGHIPGSVLIPVNEIKTRWNELDPNDWIITYCT